MKYLQSSAEHMVSIQWTPSMISQRFPNHPFEGCKIFGVIHREMAIVIFIRYELGFSWLRMAEIIGNNNFHQ